MAFNRTRSPEAILRDADERRKPTRRYDDLCLILRNREGKILLSQGGRWDNVEHCYLDGPAPQACIVEVKDSQVPYVTWLARWLTAFKDNTPRSTRVVLTAGKRRGGKTTSGVFTMLAMALAVPGSIIWAVSPSYEKRDELDLALKQFFPKAWYTYKGSPRFRYIFHNGSVIRHLSGDDPDILKQGKVDLVMLNEAQLMDSRALTNALPGTIDRGGLTLMAANPATRAIGVWVNELKEAIDTNKVHGVKFFDFDPAKNDAVDQSARSDIGDILRVVDPKVAAADDEGLWLAVGDVAYRFQTAAHVKAKPEIGDITREYTKQKFGRSYDYLAGADFQGVPHHAAVIYKIFRGLDGKPIYWAVDEVLKEGTEEDLLDAVDEKGLYSPDNTVWVGDASGTWQDGAHKRGRASFDCFKARRWHIHPPRKAKNEMRNPSNPPVEDRLNVVNNLLAQHRLMIDPVGAPRLAIAFKKCELRNHKPRGKYAHVTDAAGYAIFAVEPKPLDGGGGSKAWSVRINRGNGF
jgi:hypothetical protein